MQSCAVVGCGPAGMAATTLIRQSGLLVTCFEMANTPGGMWASNGRDTFTSRGLLSPIYPAMRCVLPKDLMSFSDSRFDFTVPQLPHFSAVRRYLEQHADRKGVRAITRFNTKVESVRYDPQDRQWKIVTVNVCNGDVLEWTFDNVCVCTGQTNEVRYPVGARERLKAFVEEGGELHHSAHVKNFRAFKGKRVVVVGDGVSAYDYMKELVRNGAEVIHSTTATSHPATPLSVPPSGVTARVVPLSLREMARWQLRGLLPPHAPLTHAEMVNGLIKRWVQFECDELARVPRVGEVIRGDGRGILFMDIDAANRSTEDTLKEARRRYLARRSATVATEAAADGGERRSCEEEPPQSTGDVSDDCTMVDNVDVVIFATGFNVRFPFLHPTIRCAVEDDNGGMKRLTEPSGTTKESLDGCSGVGHSPLVRTELFLGTIYKPLGTLAFVGIQKDLLPPFLMFEAQARFIAYAFSGRVDLPLNDHQALHDREAELEAQCPPLRQLKCGTAGMGYNSAAYYDVLQQELQVHSKDTFTKKILERQRWVLLTTALRIVHKLRSMAPLKRRQQHLLFSNKV